MRRILDNVEPRGDNGFGAVYVPSIPTRYSARRGDGAVRVDHPPRRRLSS